MKVTKTLENNQQQSVSYKNSVIIKQSCLGLLLKFLQHNPTKQIITKEIKKNMRTIYVEIHG